MARNEKRGKRDRRADQHDGKISGPPADAEDRKPTDDELAKLRPSDDDVRRRRDVE